MDEKVKHALRQAREHYERREYDKAQQLLLSIFNEVDQFADVHNMLGVISHARGAYRDAELYFSKALILNPNYTEASLNLAVTYNDLGKYDLARQVHEQAHRASSRSPNGVDAFVLGKIANMHGDIAQAYVDAGMPRDAIPELEKAVSLCPAFVDLRTRLGQLYREIGDISRARTQYEAAIQINGKYHPAKVALAVVLIALDEKDNAIVLLEEVLAVDSDNRTAQMYLRMLKSIHKDVP